MVCYNVFDQLFLQEILFLEQLELFMHLNEEWDHYVIFELTEMYTLRFRFRKFKSIICGSFFYSIQTLLLVFFNYSHILVR